VTSVAVLDYGMGNLRSVAKALEAVGATVSVTNAVPDTGTDLLVVPGQGHFGACVRTLGPEALQAIRNWIRADRPYLGICLGLQLLFKGSEESSEPGTGVLEGDVIRFTKAPTVPHIGWNQIDSSGDSSGLLREFDGSRFYFVHSFFPAPTDNSVVAATSEHGERFCAAVAQGQMLATQFHPEKSGDAGLALLEKVIKAAA
jgi:imidazole glycerol phosphate synthase glutamine amidotransferase subunit